MSLPVTIKDVPLCNSILATTNVKLVSEMQVATVQFKSAVGKLGEIILSPTQPVATNLEYKVGNQVLKIEKINFQAAFGLNSGEVQCKGSATDQQGNNPVVFGRQIASWEN